MTSLKDAAKDLVDILYGADNTAPNLYVGLVPFAASVNIGSARTSWIVPNAISAKNWGPSSWGGCVDAGFSTNLDLKDDPPTTTAAKYQPFYWGDEADNDWIRSGSYYISNSGTYSIGPNAYCPSAVTPMTTNKATIVNGINAMQARGSTHVNFGAVWGWRMLSPRWRTLWGGDMNANGLPLDYNTPKMNKAVVLMTDGENTFSDSTRTAYGKLSDYGVNEATAVAELNRRLTLVCDSMKNAGIIVYTVAFRSPGASIETLLKGCATQPKFYFDSPSSDDLKVAFRTIGDSLSNLRLSM